jgi:predicted O-methyltransferase YrrM
MKKLPEIKNDWSGLYKLVRIGTQNTIFLKAIKMKIFDYLTAAVPAQTVVVNMKSHPRNTELFLNALAGMGLIQKVNGLFCNTEKSAEFLVSGSPTYLGAFFLHVTEWSQDLGNNLESLVKNGPPEQNPADMAAGEIWANSARLSAAYQYSGEAQRITRIVSSLPEFPKMKTMLDLGGGSGLFTIAITGAHPEMQGIIFEQPAVAAVAREFIQKFEMERRVSTREGNYITDALGGPYDLIFAASTLNFCKHNLDDLFRKIYDSLNPAGLFITLQDGIKDERTQPVYHITEFLLPEFMGMDFAITQGAIAETMLLTKFKSVRSFTVHSNFGEMDMDIGRK